MKDLWDKTGEHLYETGTDRGMVYPADNSGTYPKGYPWNGLTGYTESPSGADETALYADNQKYLSLRSAEEFGATITAYTFPEEFAKLDGSANLIEGVKGIKVYQQSRKSFGFAVRTLIGNDIDSNDHGYKLHLLYGLTASPSEKGYSTVNDSPEAIEFSWEIKSVPVAVPGFKPTSVITIDSTEVDPTKLAALEDILYGKYDDTFVEATPVGTENPSTEGWYEKAGDNYFKTTDTTVVSSKTYYVGSGATEARLPLPAEIITLFSTTVGG